MIAAFSTSSSVTSLAILEGGGEILFSREEEAPRAASGAAIRMLQAGLLECGLELDQFAGFVADLGPGSFTGVKVGVTLAKTFGFIYRVPVSGALAFDLIDPTGPVCVPCKRGEWFVREAGSVPFRTETPDFANCAGFGLGFENPVYPSAHRFSALLASLEWIEPEKLVPSYLLEPSISTPKRPFGVGKGEPSG